MIMMIKMIMMRGEDDHFICKTFIFVYDYHNKDDDNGGEDEERKRTWIILFVKQLFVYMIMMILMRV